MLSSTPNHLAIAAPALSPSLPICHTVFCHTSDNHCEIHTAVAHILCQVVGFTLLCLLLAIEAAASALLYPAAFAFWANVISSGDNCHRLDITFSSCCTFIFGISCFTCCGVTVLPKAQTTQVWIGGFIGLNICGIAICLDY